MNKQQVVNVRVLCRLRPDDSQEEKIKLESKKLGEVLVYPKNDSSNFLKFEFDHVFPKNASQEEVYEISAKPIVDDAILGFNGTILAYGQTASGKTYTITGSDIFDVQGMGLIPRMISKIFDHIDASDNSLEFGLKVSYTELYLEKIVDLLDVDKKGLKIREDKISGFYISNITEVPVSSDFEIFELLRIGTENRHIMNTKMNSRSSRSHTIFNLSISVKNLVDQSNRLGKLNFVDLAGSERVSKTGAEGLRLKELKNINKSLNALTSVINSLTDPKSTHIPYRDSKLTKLLQTSIGGNSKTVMIITCSTLLKNESETITTLRFGSVAKCIKNKPKINRELTLAELRVKLLKIEEELKKKAAKITFLEELLKNPLPTGPELFPQKSEDFCESVENDELLIELEELSNKLNGLIDENTKKRIALLELKNILNDVEKSRKNDEDLIKVLENKQEVMQTGIQSKTLKLRKLEIEKDVLSDKLEKGQTRKFELERLLNERNVENNDLKIKFQVLIEKNEAPAETSQVEELKEKLIDEQKRYKKNQAELQELQFRLNLALKEQLQDRHSEEKSILDREVQARELKINESQKELEAVEDGSRIVKMILTQDEAFLNINTEDLEAKLKDLAEMYKILNARQSSSNIEKQINVRKVSRLNERIAELEKELKVKSEQLKKVEYEANRYLDEMANQSILNKVRVPIRGGGGKGNRNQTYSRLSIKPRMFASLTVKMN
jgi:kinesin family protein 5